MQYYKIVPQMNIRDTFIRLLRYLIVLVCVFLVISFVNNVSQSIQMRNVLEEAQLSLEEVKNTQETLKQDLAIVESDFYSEKEARNKLGLVKENEIVLVLPSEDLLRKLSNRKQTKQDYKFPDENWKKWLQLFM